MDTPPLPSDFDGLTDGDDAAEYERIWALLRTTDDERGASFDVDDEWDRLADRLDLDSTPAASDPQKRRAPDREAHSSAAHRVPRRWMQTLAAAVLVIALVGAGAWWWSQPVSVTTPPGQQTTVSLPDGSSVELNGATTLTYARGFSSLLGTASSARRVTLDGEAFFSVVSADRPFRVHTANARVEVLGTSFNVRTRAEQSTPATAVAVLSGRVQVTGTDESVGTAAVTLDETGEMSRVVGTNAPSPPQSIDLKYVQAWRQGGFAMTGASLPAILRELERRFGTSLRLTAPVAKTDTMTLHYARNARLEDVLRDICLIQNLSYRQTSRGYELVEDAQ
jgi:transmembrane sensor